MPPELFVFLIPFTEVRDFTERLHNGSIIVKDIARKGPTEMPALFALWGTRR